MDSGRWKMLLYRYRQTLVIISVVFVCTFGVAMYAITASIARLHKEAEQNLSETATEFIADTTNDLTRGIATLNAIRGYFAGTDHVTRENFYQVIATSGFLETYHGFSTVGYIERVPEKNKQAFIEEVQHDTTVNPTGYPSFQITPSGKRSEYFPITYFYPEDRATALLGMDEALDPIRSEDIFRARDTGEVAFSHITPLLQGGFGVVLAIPLYRGNITPATIDERRAAFIGAITSAVDIQNFFQHILATTGIQSSPIHIKVTGPSKNSYAIQEPKGSTDFFSSLYGNIQIDKTLPINADTTYVFSFHSSVSSQLADATLTEPILIALAFLGAFLLFVLFTFYFQRRKTLVDLQKQYQFISIISHQLRTPMTAALWGLESLKVPRSSRRQLHLVRQRLLNLNTIVQKLLLFMEMTNGLVLKKTTDISLEELFVAAEKLLQTASEKKRIRRKTYLHDVMTGDKEKLSYAMFCLLDNALTYSPKGTPVDVVANTRTSGIDIRVIDRGYGIPPAEQKRTFDEFFRASNASLGKNEGSGVGLTIAKRIIEAHGGQLSFKSGPHGSVFTIHIPLAQKKRPGALRR